MSTPRRLFDIQKQGETLILSPKTNMSELELSSFDDETRAVMRQFEEAGLRNVVLDFTGTDYYGSTALGFFIKLWKRVRNVDGKMAFCNVSDHEREVLKLTRLDSLWTICGSRDEAMHALEAK
jgi:anti-anti-sigma factor